MNVDIAEHLKNKLAGAPYAERIAGLCRPVETKSGGNVRRIPMACKWSVSPSDCPETELLIPDASLSSLLWFEDGGAIFKERNGRDITYTSTLRLICWLNLRKYEHECSVTAAVAMDIIFRLLSGNENTTNYSSVRVVSISQLVKNESVFSAYIFANKPVFLTYPYDFIGMEIKTDFTINSNCIKPITRQDVRCI